MDLTSEDLFQLYRLMRLTRGTEEYLRGLAQQNLIAGPIPSLRGSEAVTVGAALALADGDAAMPHWHDLGTYLACGVPLSTVLARWRGRDGLPAGKHGGYSGDLHTHHIGPVSETPGKWLAIAAGMALAMQLRAHPYATLAAMQPEDLESGATYEALRFAVLRALPLVGIMACPLASMPAGADDLADLVARLGAFGVRANIVAGTDPLAMYQATRVALAAARAGGGPAVLVAGYARLASPTRFASSSPDAMSAAAGSSGDPISNLAAQLTQRGLLAANREHYDMMIDSELVAAIHAVDSLPPPTPDALNSALFAATDGLAVTRPLVPGRTAAPVLSEKGEQRA